MNTAAFAALRSITMAQADMATAQKHIATGYRVGSPDENAAYWSIATTMRSDVNGLNAVKDALGLGNAISDIAYTGVNSAIKVVDQIKQKLIAAREPGVDRSKIQSDISALQGQLQSTVDASSMSGQNWLKIDSTNGTDITKEIVASLSKDTSGILSVGKMTVNLYTASTGATMGLMDSNTTASAKAGILDKERTMTSGTTYNILSLDIKAFTDSPADLGDLDSIISGVDASIMSMTSSATDLGALKARIALQTNFIKDLTTAIEQGVSELVDADMNEESTRLQALQTKQSLGIQALSIANSSAQSLLRLFQ